MRGYTGKILFVDLTSGESRAENVPDAVYEQVLAGVGLGAHVLYQHIPAGTDPLGPGNMLGFVSGLLTGTPSLITGRWLAVCKSPLTGGWGDANCGGTFGAAIKQCGFDGIFVTGAAERPVYLLIDNDGAQIREADHLWGVDAVQAEKELQAAIQQETGKPRKPAVAVIGMAGEKCSLISGIVNDSGRLAARSGVGAVMGSKKLKAVVLAGTQQVKVSDAAGMRAISKTLAEKISKQNLPKFLRGSMIPLVGKLLLGSKKAGPGDGIMTAAFFKKWGTNVGNTLSASNGDGPVKNWVGSVVQFNASYYRNLNPDHILRREVRKYHCTGCALACGSIVDIKDIGSGKFEHAHKPEYETCAAFGGLVMNKSMETIFLVNELLNRAGMDSISAGSTVAFAMECYEKGILTRESTGLDLTWGNHKAIIALVKKMIARDGIGDVLADGVKAAAARIGQGAEQYAMHAGGQEPGMHDPRLDPLLGLHFSADPTPGRHTIGTGSGYDTLRLWEKVSWAPHPGTYRKEEMYTASEKFVIKTVANACYKTLTDGAGGCLFAMSLGSNHWQLFEMLNAATGWQKSPDEYMEIGKRIQTLRQLFNIKHGIDPWQFRMSRRVAGEPPLAEGPLKGKTVPVDALMRLHWKLFGWDEQTGAPTPETVAALGLG